MGGLHRLADDGAELAAGCVEIDLVAQAGVERLERSGGVVAAPVEAPVDERLDAGTGRTEERRNGESRAGGKRSLWQVLSQLQDPRLAGFDFEQLVDRADKQLTRIEAHRLGASGKAFGGGRDPAEVHSADRSSPGT